MEIVTILAWIIIFFGGLTAVFLGFQTLYHRYQLRREAEKFPPPGELVLVNKKNMHVYREGHGDITLVFMSGHGTSCPTIDFKPVWMRMSGEYRIAVVEKPGYGWSETSSSPRDIDTMLEETRTALRLSGENGPYVLIPHSMSGLEAIYWVQKYPSEVKGIIGLDPAVPDVYGNFSGLLSQKKKLNLMYYIIRLGFSRYMGITELEKNLPLIRSEELSERDKDTMKAVFHKNAITKNMLKEIDFVQENAEKVKVNGIPLNTPMYFFISDARDVIFPNWQEYLSEYVLNGNLGQFTYLDCGHYMHHEKSASIAKKAKEFLKEIY